MDTLFDTITQKSYGYNPDEYENSAGWRIVRKLFLDNYHPNGVVCKIPKIIHQIWLGGQLPKVYEKYAESWRKFHPGWEYRLWTDKNISPINIKSRDHFDRTTNPGMKSDILRYEILQKYGGLYIDTDFECLKPFDDLMYLDFFTGISYDGVLQLYNGLIACVPDHPIIKSCTDIREPYTSSKGSIVLGVTGANHFTRCFLRNLYGKVIAFPIDYFYPFPNNLINKDDPYKYVTENSYAIHHWAVSWSRKNQRKLKMLANVSK